MSGKTEEEQVEHESVELVEFEGMGEEELEMNQDPEEDPREDDIQTNRHRGNGDYDLGLPQTIEKCMSKKAQRQRHMLVMWGLAHDHVKSTFQHNSSSIVSKVECHRCLGTIDSQARP